MDLPKRKHTRFKSYDYSRNGCYFITICVKDRTDLLGTITERDAITTAAAVGRDALIPPKVELTQTGRIVEKYIKNIDLVYEGVSVEKYVIMPNHVHLLLMIFDPPGGGMRASRPTLHTIVRSLKTMVTRQVGYSFWQDSYYEHIVRNEQSYLEIWQYIDENPQKWKNDDY